MGISPDRVWRLRVHRAKIGLRYSQYMVVHFPRYLVSELKAELESTKPMAVISFSLGKSLFIWDT